jgi:pantothenate kinase-related protein Tda10
MVWEIEPLKKTGLKLQVFSKKSTLFLSFIHLLLEPVDIVLLEGWMLGFQAKPLLKVEDCADAIQQFKILYPTVNEVELFRNISDVNDKLREYKTMHELIDSWIVYQISDVSIVYQWRLQAEHDLHRKFNRGLSDEQVRSKYRRITSFNIFQLGEGFCCSIYASLLYLLTCYVRTWP